MASVVAINRKVRVIPSVSIVPFVPFVPFVAVHLLDNSNRIADKLCFKFSDLVTDTDAEPQPVVSGYIEFAGEIVKISSVEDIERVLERINVLDKA